LSANGRALPAYSLRVAEPSLAVFKGPAVEAAGNDPPLQVGFLTNTCCVPGIDSS